MSPSGTPNLENRNSAVSSGNAAQVSHPSQQFTNCLYPTNRQTMPSRCSSGASFSLRALQQHDSTEHQPSAAQNYSILHSQSHPASSHSEPLRREGREMLTSCYNNHPQGFPISVCQGVSSIFEANDSSRVLSKTDIPESTASPVTSLEALLDTLSVIQQKIQQLQAVVQLIAHGTSTIPQQQRTLATGIASMISELLVASAGLMQQPPAGSTQLSASNPLFNSIIGGTSISGINTSQQGAMGNPLSTLLGNFMGSTFESVCAPSRYCLPSLAGMGTNSAMRVGIEGSEMDNSERRDGNLGEQGLVPPPGSSAISLAPIIGNTSGCTAEINIGAKVSPDRALGVTGNHGMDGVVNQLMIHGNEALHSPSAEDHDTGLGLKDDDDDDDGERENLPPDSYELIEMDAAEVLAEHTHFCEICGKGFKRDANLRMHMRGHGDEYKTPAALARPDKSTHALSTVRPRRYSCPFVGCKRNKKHRKFQPLKTVLCVKNHYRRSHCPKMLTCNKCKMKKFSVVADLKTHEKHCGRDKWQCSCGTTFSRKDKLLGHIGLFAGHIPALPLSETESSAGGLETLPYCFNSGHGEGWQGTLCDEAAQVGAAQFNLVHGNESAINPASIVGSSSQGMDMTDETARGVRAGRSEGLQALGHRQGCTANSRTSQDGCSSPSSLAGAFVSNSSIFHDLLSSNFLHQADGNN